MSTISPPTLDQSLVELLNAVKLCQDNKSIDSAAQACSASRTAWSAYYDEWLVSSKEHLHTSRINLEEYLHDCLDAVKHISTENLNEEDAVRLGKYKENIEFRYHLLNILHTCGIEGVERALAEWTKRS
jgi:hypothetical protein